MFEEISICCYCGLLIRQQRNGRWQHLESQPFASRHEPLPVKSKKIEHLFSPRQRDFIRKLNEVKYV